MVMISSKQKKQDGYGRLNLKKKKKMIKWWNLAFCQHFLHGTWQKQHSSAHSRQYCWSLYFLRLVFFFFFFTPSHLGSLYTFVMNWGITGRLIYNPFQIWYLHTEWQAERVWGGGGIEQWMEMFSQVHCWVNWMKLNPETTITYSYCLLLPN